MRHKFTLEIDIPDEVEDVLIGTVDEWVYDSIKDAYVEIYEWEPNDTGILLKEVEANDTTNKQRDVICPECESISVSLANYKHYSCLSCGYVWKK